MNTEWRSQLTLIGGRGALGPLRLSVGRAPHRRSRTVCYGSGESRYRTLRERLCRELEMSFFTMRPLVFGPDLKTGAKRALKQSVKDIL